MSALCRDCFWTGDDAFRCPVCASPRLLRHPELHTLSIAHLDCDAFYASVEKRDRPEVRDQPVIVGGGVRGVVTTCCYIARTYGVRSAMPMFKALKACPEAVVIKPDFKKYTHESRRIMAILRNLTPLVQPLSLDEAWLDLTGAERLNGGSSALTMAKAQAEIERETGLTVSVGLAANKFLAKIASDLDKPRGFAVLGAEAKTFLAAKPVSILPGVGPAFVRSLEREGLRTVGDIARTDVKALASKFGVGGLRLAELAQGRDTREINPDGTRKSISAETTFNTDLTDRQALENVLWPLCEKVAERARAGTVAGRVVTLKLRTADFRIHTRRRALGLSTQTARSLFAVGRELLAGEVDGRAFRLIGIGLSDLHEADTGAASLFEDGEERSLKAERAVDALRQKFGRGAIVTGRSFRAAEPTELDSDLS